MLFQTDTNRTIPLLLCLFAYSHCTKCTPKPLCMFCCLYGSLIFVLFPLFFAAFSPLLYQLSLRHASSLTLVRYKPEMEKWEIWERFARKYFRQNIFGKKNYRSRVQQVSGDRVCTSRDPIPPHVTLFDGSALLDTTWNTGLLPTLEAPYFLPASI